MTSPLANQVIQVNQYNLVQSREAYIAAIKALAQRTEEEGHSGVLAYKFFTDTNTETAGAVITYVDASAWQAHHEIAYQWEEMAQLQATVQLQRLTLFGPLNESIKARLAEAGLSYTHYDLLAGGFIRP